ncbi:hypothetical protein [Lonsdalea quercina]|uniref:hypothetical protein n=1 Tax=Lonsdalea quercina TaxID=71657 RepID=UPI003976EFA3
MTIVASISLGIYSIVIACGLSLLCQFFIVFIGVVRGVAVRPNKMETYILLFVCISIALWFFTGKPSLAIYVNILVDILGTIIILKKMVQRPATESPSTWFIGTLGSGLSVWYFYTEIGVGFYYIFTVFLSNTTVFFLIVLQTGLARMEGEHGNKITKTIE